LVEVRIAG